MIGYPSVRQRVVVGMNEHFIYQHGKNAKIRVYMKDAECCVEQVHTRGRSVSAHTCTAHLGKCALCWGGWEQRGQGGREAGLLTLCSLVI